MTLELEREAVVQSLCAHYAQDHLTTGELETRFDTVYRAADRIELRAALAGLPSIGHQALSPPPLFAVGSPSEARAGDEKRYAAVFSSVNKEGHWVPARRIVAKVVFGSILLDMREAELPPEGVELDVDVIFGELKVILAPGIGADVDCTAMLATVEDLARRPFPGAPVIRVRGGALFGTITVVTKLPKPARLENWRKQLKQLLGSVDVDTTGRS